MSKVSESVADLSTRTTFDGSREGLAILAFFSAAAYSSRALLLCKPRPSGVDIEDIRQSLADVVDGTPSGSSTSSAIVSLLRERIMQCILASNALEEHRWRHLISGSPDLVLEVRTQTPAQAAAFNARTSTAATTWAFHGTPFENIWSLLSCGFVNAAQVTPGLARSGEGRGIFGQGIYLSTDFAYAATFARGCPQLPNSLGSWKAVLICEVAPGPLVTIGGRQDEVTAERKEAHNVPEGVIVVEDSDAVAIRAVMLWQTPDSGSWLGVSAEMIAFLVVIVAILYAMWTRTSPSYAKL